MFVRMQIMSPMFALHPARRRPAPSPRGRHQGFTLVEMMVGVVVGLFIVGVAASAFVAARHSFLVQDNSSHMQESARAMLEDITRELRKAGSFGCYRWKDLSTPVYITATMPAGTGGVFPLRPINANAVVQGGNVSGLSLPLLSGITPVTGTDFFSVLYGQPVATLTVNGGNGMLPSVWSNYTLNRSITVATGQPMAIADCETVTIFRVDNNGVTSSLQHLPAAGNNTQPTYIVGTDQLLAGNAYSGGAIVMWLEMPTFFVAEDGSGLRSLYRWDSSVGGGIQPMIPNVEQMRVVFGVDAASAPGHLNSADQWLTGQQVSDAGLWGNVVSASVHLVLRSDDQGGASTQPHQYAWDSGLNMFTPTVAPSDRYIRQVHVINAALRNRVPIMN